MHINLTSKYVKSGMIVKPKTKHRTCVNKDLMEFQSVPLCLTSFQNLCTHPENEGHLSMSGSKTKQGPAHGGHTEGRVSFWLGECSGLQLGESWSSESGGFMWRIL